MTLIASKRLSNTPEWENDDAGRRKCVVGRTWDLMQGDNAVRVRGVDVNGNAGIVSSITVTMTGATHTGNHHGFYVGTSGNSSKFWSGVGW
jgi:hypothetical protein